MYKKMNSNEMTGICVNILEIPKKVLNLKRQRSYSIDKINEIDRLKAKIKHLEESCVYWKEKTIKLEYEVKELNELYLHEL